MRRVLLVAAAVSLTTVLATTASAAGDHGQRSATPFTSCPRVFNGTNSFQALAVSQIGVRRISCAAAYHHIERFPDQLRPYRCTHRFTAGDSFKYVCTAGSKAFRFTAQGE